MGALELFTRKIPCFLSSLKLERDGAGEMGAIVGKKIRKSQMCLFLVGRWTDEEKERKVEYCL